MRIESPHPFGMSELGPSNGKIFVKKQPGFFRSDKVTASFEGGKIQILKGCWIGKYVIVDTSSKGEHIFAAMQPCLPEATSAANLTGDAN